MLIVGVTRTWWGGFASLTRHAIKGDKQRSPPTSSRRITAGLGGEIIENIEQRVRAGVDGGVDRNVDRRFDRGID